MITSMTAFSRIETDAWVWEVRSLNHRFLDLSFSLPSTVRVLEPDLHSLAKKLIHRGRIEATLAETTPDLAEDPRINEEELHSLLLHMKTVQMATSDFNEFKAAEYQINVLDMLRWPGVMKQQCNLSSNVHDDICLSFHQVLEKLVSNRQREGEAIESLFANRLGSIREILIQVQNAAVQQIELIREKLERRISKLGVDADPNRIAQEVAILAQRADVHEEIDRLQVHIADFENCMRLNEPQGRRLSFIVQEMARESNTLAAKLAPPEAVRLTVDLKVLIDQLREQIQNVE